MSGSTNETTRKYWQVYIGTERSELGLNTFDDGVQGNKKGKAKTPGNKHVL